MTQDFAKQHRSAPSPETGLPRWTWFITGFATGAFIAFLLALWYFVPAEDIETVTAVKPVAEPEALAKEIDWGFYEIFPKSVVPVVEEYAESGEKITTDQFAWILQAGSFTDPDDADEMRASLILMGLDVTVSEVEVDGKDWHRIVVGPFDTELERNRAQDRLAQAEIKSMPIRIPR